MVVLDPPGPIPALAQPCTKFFLQSPDMQRYLLLKLLCATASALQIEITCTDEFLKAASTQGWCQGSSAQLQLDQATLIIQALNLQEIQPICWTPLQLEGAITYVIYLLTNYLDRREVL